MVAGHAVASMIHIHNGDVAATLARRSDIPGEHSPYRETLVTGPVVPGPEWIETRAHAIAEAHGHDLLRVRTELSNRNRRSTPPRNRIRRSCSGSSTISSA
jgi:hypothetical protein